MSSDFCARRFGVGALDAVSTSRPTAASTTTREHACWPAFASTSSSATVRLHCESRSRPLPGTYCRPVRACCSGLRRSATTGRASSATRVSKTEPASIETWRMPCGNAACRRTKHRTRSTSVGRFSIATATSSWSHRRSSRWTPGDQRLPDKLVPFVARVRTDLDSFSMPELSALMFLGYTTIDHCLNAYQRELLPETPPPLKFQFPFGGIFKDWDHPTDEEIERAIAHLRVSGSRLATWRRFYRWRNKC